LNRGSSPILRLNKSTTVDNREQPLHRQYSFISKGTIKYDPPRPGLKKKRDWWCIVKAPEGLARYYKHQVDTNLGIQTTNAAWGSHISIIRGEKPRPEKMHLWKKYDGNQITFVYTHNVYGNGEHYWVNVWAPELTEIRKEFGLKHDWGHHLTVAKVWERYPIRDDQWLNDEYKFGSSLY
jgi:hypothetical protein